MYLYSWPLFHVWRLAGVAPVVRMELVKGKTIYKVSPLLVVYSICLILLLVLASVYPQYLEVNQVLTIRMKTQTAVVGCISDNISLIIGGVVGVLANSWYSAKIIKLMEKVRKIDRDLKFTYNSDKFVKFVLYYFMALSAQTCFDIVNWYNINHNSLYYIPTYFFHHMIFTMEFQYVDVVLQLKKRFIALNGLYKVSLDQEKSLVTGMNFHRVDEDERNYVENLSITKLTNLHWSLCGVIEDVNETYGCQTLVVMFSILIHIVITPYFFLLGIAYPLTNSDKNTEYLLLQGIWTVFHIAQLVIVTWSCSTATEMANNTAPMISRYLLYFYEEDSLREIESCMLQLMHHKTAFSACGLFDLNLPLITTVCGAVTTYLVILIQFQNADG